MKCCHKITRVLLLAGILLTQSIACLRISAAEENVSESSIFLKKYTFNPNTHYDFAGHLYPALDIKEPDVEYIVKSLKTINQSSGTTENIEKLYGPVHEKNSKSGVQEWKYNYIFSRELNAQQKYDLEKLTKEYERLSLIVVDKKANLQIEQEHERYPELGVTDKKRTDPALISSLEEKMKAINEKTMAIELTQKQTLIQIIFKISETGKIKNIDLNKITDDGTSSCLYTKSREDESDASSVNNQQIQMPKDVAFSKAPPNPYPGMIYLNTSEKHFYGWDGTSWLKMDMKP